MSDNDKYTMSDDDEFNFTSDEYVIPAESADASEHAEDESQDDVKATASLDYDDDDADAEPEPTQEQSGVAAILEKAVSLFKNFSNKRVLVALGMGLFLLVIFKIFSSEHDATRVISSTPVNAAVVKQAVTQPAPMISRQINALRQDDMNSQNAVKNLKGQMQQLKAVMQTSAVDETQMTASVKVLTRQVQALSAVVKNLAKQPTKQTHEKVVPVKKIHYYLKAVVPGRAWVKGSNGTAFTVRVGNHLKQYGTVESIDVNRGMILMSTGKVISYGQDDS